MTASAVLFWLIAAGLGLLIALYRRTGPVRRLALWAAIVLAPAIMLGATISWTGRSGEFRLALKGFNMDRGALEQPFCVGGNNAPADRSQRAECDGDDLAVNGLPSGFARLTADAGETVAWRFATDALGAKGETGVAAIQTGDEPSEIAGSLPLLPGTRFCVVGCDRPDATVFRLDAEGTGLERISAGSTSGLPLFKRRPFKVIYRWEMPSPLAVYWPPDQAIYALRDYGVVSARTAGTDLCALGQLLCDQSMRPVRSFIYRTSGKSDGLRILFLDPGARIIGSANSPVPSIAPVTDKALTVRLYSVEFGAGFEDLAAKSRPVARLRLRTAFVTRATGDHTSLDLQRDPVSAISAEVIRTESRGDNTDPLPMTITAVPGSSRLPLIVDSIGGRLARNLETRIILQPEDHGARSNLFLQVGTTEPVRLGRPFMAGELGSERGGTSEATRAAVFQLERLDLPASLLSGLGMLAALLLWGGLLCRAQQQIAPDNIPAWLILAVVQWILAIRLAIGVESAILDPQLSLAIAIGGNIATLFAVPLLFVACTPGIKEDRLFALLPCLIFAGGALAASVLTYGLSSAGWLSIAILIFTSLIALGWARLRAGMEPVLAKGASIAESPWPMIMGIVLVLGALTLFWLNQPGWQYAGASGFTILATANLWRIRGVFGSRAGLLPKSRLLIASPWFAVGGAVSLIVAAGLFWFEQTGWQIAAGLGVAILIGTLALRVSWWAALFISLILFRIVLLGFNAKERIYWPTPFAISIIYVPLMLLAFAGLFAAAARGRQHVRFDIPLWVIFPAALFLLLLLVPFAVSDIGLAIYILPLAAMGWAFARNGSKDKQDWRWKLPALGTVAAVALLAGWGFVQDTGWRADVRDAVEKAGAPAAPDVHDAAVRRVAALLEKVNADDQNGLRLWRVFAPERTVIAGTTDAESQRRVAAILQDYTGTLTGRGYAAASDPGDIRTYQADDNVSAVHLMSPYGRIGAALFLLVLGMLAARLDKPDSWSDPGVTFGRLALWTILASAAYMVLANLQLVPFTGRNIYLLAGLSISDLVEGTALFLIALRGLARVQ